MNRGYGWADKPFPFRHVGKRSMESDDSVHAGYECQFCGRVFKRKHVRWVGDGWICRDRCERIQKGLP